MIYVMILTVFAVHGVAGAPNPVTAEYNTQDDCLKAGKDFDQKVKATFSNEGMVTVFTCSPKGVTPP